MLITVKFVKNGVLYARTFFVQRGWNLRYQYVKFRAETKDTMLIFKKYNVHTKACRIFYRSEKLNLDEVRELLTAFVKWRGGDVSTMQIYIDGKRLVYLLVAQTC